MRSLLGCRGFFLFVLFLMSNTIIVIFITDKELMVEQYVFIVLRFPIIHYLQIVMKP